MRTLIGACTCSNVVVADLQYSSDGKVQIGGTTKESEAVPAGEGKSEKLRVTKDSVDTKQRFKISELEAEVSLLRGRIKSLNQQLDEKTAGSGQPVHVDGEGLDEMYEIPKNQLEQCQLLGNGAFAEVYQGWWRKAVAIKKFRRVSRQDQLDSFARETKILRLMHHSGIPYFW